MQTGCFHAIFLRVCEQKQNSVGNKKAIFLTINFFAMKTRVLCAVSGNSRMEAETISKNEASQKSQMSRGNFFRNVGIALLAMGLMIGGLLFTSCSVGGNSPSSVVKKVMKATMQKDADAVFKCFYSLPDYRKESLRNQFEKASEYDMVKFEIQDERIYDNGEKAEVTVKTYLKNGREDTDKVPLVKTTSGWKIHL